MKFDILKPQSTSGTGKKAIQEDSVFPALGEGTIHDKLFIVADGCGGDGKGFEASECFCQTVSDFFFQNTCPDEPLTDEMLDEALLNAANAIEHRCPDSLGTNFALLYLHRHGVMAAHVGSSGIYHIRPKEREILYHSTKDERIFVPKAEHLVLPTKAHIVNVQYGDYFVLLTQGANAYISESKMLEVICEPVNDNTKLIRLIKQLSDCQDNYSITIVHVSGVMNEAMDEHLEGSVLTAAVTSQVASSAQEAATEGLSKGATEETPVARQKKSGSSQSPAQQNRGVRSQRDEQPEKPAKRRETVTEEEESEKSGFPVVLVTALLIVALGALGWWWMNKSTQRNEVETPAIEVKKDSVKKDTVNIMKGEKPKAIDLPEDKKESKTEQPQQKQEEKPAEPVVSETDNIGNSVPQPEVDDVVQPQQPQQPAEEFKSEVTPVTTPDPGTVTPRPVIPEDE